MICKQVMNSVYTKLALPLIPICYIALELIFFCNKTIGLGGTIKVYRGMNVGSFIASLGNNVSLSFTDRLFIHTYLRNSIYHGNYSFNSGTKLVNYLRLVRGRVSDMCNFTFIPGKTIYYYKQALMGDDNFYGNIGDVFEEGDILPNTYTYRCQSSRNLVMNYARRSMKSYLGTINESIDYGDFYLKNIKEVVTLASIVEMEAGSRGEMSIIASVFKNRLKLGMRLQSDPTVIYQLSGGTGILGRRILLNDLAIDGVYNTYTRAGVPQAPISNPSKDAIMAVISPRNTNYLYFVADGAGTHRFAKTYKEHLANVSLYRNLQEERKNATRVT